MLEFHLLPDTLAVFDTNLSIDPASVAVGDSLIFVPRDRQLVLLEGQAIP